MPRLKSIQKEPASKPAKSRADFPLWKHPSGRWCKKVRGRAHYFGKVADDPHGQAALARWLEVKDDLLAGRQPRVQGEGLTLKDLANRFLTVKKALVDSGELSPRTFQDWYRTCKLLLDTFGKGRLVTDLAADDFESLRANLAAAIGPRTVQGEVQRTRGLFRYEAGLIDKPVRFGPAFKAPRRQIIEQARRENGERMFEPHELHKLLDAATPPVRAMILLGVNCGYGNTDVAELPQSALDLDAGWADYPRPKTGVPRRCPLWPETIAAARVAIDRRPDPKDSADNGLVFLTRYGTRWVRYSKKTWLDNVTRAFTDLLDKTGVQRKGSFYTLRHVFRTIADETLDFPAIDLIMGHSRGDMASVYRERISDDRLRAVTEHVRKWLFGQTVDPKGTRE